MNELKVGDRVIYRASTNHKPLQAELAKHILVITEFIPRLVDNPYGVKRLDGEDISWPLNHNNSRTICNSIFCPATDLFMHHSQKIEELL